MAQEGKEIVQALIERFPVCITYVPVRDEVDFRTFCSTADAYEIRPQASLDPRAESLLAIETTQERAVAVLVPGRTFDATGTRHGKGAGWYDRFLSQVPASWTRIGFCFEDQFSQEPLMRQPWDEPMDYVVVVPRADGSPALYETGARS